MVEQVKQALAQDPFGKFLHALMLAAVLGGWATLQKNTVELARQGERLANVEAQIIAQNVERYTDREAEADRALVQAEIARLKDWLERLSNRLLDVEKPAKD